MAYWPNSDLPNSSNLVGWNTFSKKLNKATIVSIIGTSSASNLWVKATLPSGEAFSKECSDGGTANFGLLPAGTTFSYTSDYSVPDKVRIVYPVWVKIEELAVGGVINQKMQSSQRRLHNVKERTFTSSEKSSSSKLSNICKSWKRKLCSRNSDNLPRWLQVFFFSSLRFFYRCRGRAQWKLYKRSLYEFKILRFSSDNWYRFNFKIWKQRLCFFQMGRLCLSSKWNYYLCKWSRFKLNKLFNSINKVHKRTLCFY